MKAMIFAAGLGTRLKPVTDRMPKALVPVCGRPLIEHVLRKLSAAGINDVVVNVHHFADMLEAYFASCPVENMHIKVSDERDMLRETGGGIRHARRFLDGDFLIHNVDIISNLDIGALCSADRGGALATLVVSERETSRYLLFDRDMRLAGWTNAATGEVRSPYPGLDVAKCRKYAFSGIHVVSKDIFDVMDRTDEVLERQGKPVFGERFPIMDFYLHVAAEYPVTGVVAGGLKIIDVGKPDSLALAEELVGTVMPGRN